MSLVLKNVRILDENGLSDTKTIFIDGNKISRIVDGVVENTLPDDEVFDEAGRTVVPGFANCHTHLYQTFGRGLMDDLHITRWLEIIWQYPKLFSDQALYYSTLIGAIETVKSGSTVVAELIGDLPDYAIAKAITDAGLRLVYGKMTNDYPEGENTPVKSTEECLKENEEFFYRWHGKENGRITVKFSFAGLPACTDELVKGMVELSKKYGVGIHTHAAEGKEPTEQVRRRFGKGEIIALAELGALGPNTQLAHVIWIDDEEVELLAKSGASVIHCPYTNCKVTDGLSPMYKMQRAGVNITFGVDGAASSSNHDILLEARLGSMLQKVASMDEKAFDAVSVFRMLTVNGAKALGLDGVIGKIEEGYKADLLILDSHNNSKFLSDDVQLSNLIYAASGQEIVKDVIVDGRFVVKNKSMAIIDEEKILSKAREVFNREKEHLLAIKRKWV